MYELVIILVLVLLNGLFAGAEIAVISVRKTRLQELLEEGDRRARAVAKLRALPDRFLATVQIGITVVGATAAAFGGQRLAGTIAPMLADIPWVGPRAESVALALVVAFVSYLTLVLGELVPKSLALKASERYALMVARPLLGLAAVARPLVWLLTGSSNLLLRPFGDRTTFSEARLSSEELQQLVSDAVQTGALDRQAGDMASRAIDFAEVTAEEVMTPRNRMITISLAAGADAVRRILDEHPHSRLPVHDQSIDEIVGYVTAKEVFSALSDDEPLALRELLRPVQFVPETMRASEVLRLLQEKRAPFAIVVDEHGGVSGLVGVEDLVEEIVGELEDEFGGLPQHMAKQADGSIIVHGNVPIRDLNRAFSLDLSDEEQWSTVAGLSIALAGRIPREGECFTTEEGVGLEIVESSPRLVRLVRVTPPAPAPSE